MAGHVCSECGATFHRAEHLLRHRMRHLGQRPFSCPHCRRAFSRKDTLQRHLPLHEGSHRDRQQSRVKRSSNDDPRYPSTAIYRSPKSGHSEAELQEPRPTAHGAGNSGSSPGMSTRSDSLPTPVVPTAVAGEQFLSIRPGYGAAPECSGSEALQHTNALHPGFDFTPLAFGVQSSDSYPLDLAAQDPSFWDSFLDLGSLDQCPNAGFPQAMIPEISSPSQAGALISASDSGQHLPESRAPVPSFLAARASPEPNLGQAMRFDDYILNAWKYQSARIGKGQAIPLIMGAFDPILSSREKDAIWCAEDLAHVSPLPKQKYDQIVAKFEALNGTTKVGYQRFSTGAFPSITACNAFMQLFFEEFDPLFPFIHKPTFEPCHEHWLVLLALVTIGCRYSRVPAAADCVVVFQEFLRRAFHVAEAENLNKIEEDYGATREPWLAQAGLLNQIGMQFSGDLRLTESAQSIRSLIASLLDSQNALFFDLPPIIPTDLLRLKLPGPEELWRAPTAAAWLEVLRKQGECGAEQPLSIRQELNSLYRTKTYPQNLGDFSTLLLVLGIFRSALRYRHCLEDGFWSPPGFTADGLQPDDTLGIAQETVPGTRRAMEYLRILCSGIEELPRLSSLKSAILIHYHSIGILLGISLGELFCYCGYRVSSDDILDCKNRLRIWIRQRGGEARQVALHAGKLYSCIRHSNMHAYFEGHAMTVSCQALWIYGELSGVPAQQDVERVLDQDEIGVPATFRLDQKNSQHDELTWLKHGARMRPYLAGVGCIIGPDGAARLIQEVARVLCAASTWGRCQAMGKGLQLLHRIRSAAAS
ncbi:zinc finger protein 641 [Trichoderma asperellum]|uniref:Zinc finger protein 641 n=1 Tax=Trichoderma asperellum TaxID=101201 RepID=A0A6V8R0J3_TRIAP|nr:zinc finger protein 641 [Trichoderma asperellum]